MSQEEGKREIVFQMTMSAARQMLEKGLISEDEYKQFDTKMQQKYCPIFGTEPFPKKWTRKMRKKQNEANRSE